MKRQTKKMSCFDWEAVKIVKISEAIFGDSSSQYTSLYVLCFCASPYQEKFTHDDVMKLAKEKGSPLILRSLLLLMCPLGKFIAIWWHTTWNMKRRF